MRMTQPYRAHVILNCDCGEGIGDDSAILPHVTAANIACGGHAGDEASMRAALALCRRLGVSAGAQQPDAFLPDLAASLTNLGNVSSDLREPSEQRMPCRVE